MKKSSLLISLSAVVLLAGGCAKEIASSEAPAQNEGLWAVFEQPVNGFAETKALGSDYKFFWKDSEKINVFGETDGEQLTYNMEASPTSAGQFHTSNFKLIEDQTYYATYPTIGDVEDLTSVSVSFDGQVQSSNDNTDHLAQYAYSTAIATVSDNSATFDFSTKVAWFKFDFTFLVDETVTSIELKAGSAVIPTSAKLNVHTGDLVADAKADHITLALGEDGIAPVGDKLVAHLTVLPFEYEDELTVSVSCKSGNVYTTTIPSLTLESNTYYTAARTMIPAKSPLVDGKWEIYTVEHWNYVAGVKKNTEGIKLMADLDFDGATIGGIILDGADFDGNDHEISNFNIKVPNCDYSHGLIRGELGKGDITVSNLKIRNASVESYTGLGWAGILFGDIQNGRTVTLDDVSIYRSSVHGIQSLGVLAGFVADGCVLNVNDCSVITATVSNFGHPVEGESGYVCGLVGKVAGTVNFGGLNNFHDAEIDGIYAGGDSRPESSIAVFAATTGSGSVTGMDPSYTSVEVNPYPIKYFL